jgi:hypothetical protein
MAVARISVIAFMLYVCAALAQGQAQITLTVDVTDHSSARVPGAHVAVTDQATGLRSDATANASGDNIGHAVLHLDQGTYELRVQAPGFEGYMEKKVVVRAEMQKDVALTIGGINACPCVAAAPEFPLELERQPIAADIPLIPVPELVLPAKPLRHRPSSTPRNHT